PHREAVRPRGWHVHFMARTVRHAATSVAALDRRTARTARWRRLRAGGAGHGRRDRQALARAQGLVRVWLTPTATYAREHGREHQGSPHHCVSPASVLRLPARGGGAS